MKTARKTAPIPNRPEDWVIGKRKGTHVRYRNMVTGAWGPWEKTVKPKSRTEVATVEPASPIEPVLDINPGVPTGKTVEWDYASMSRDELRKLASVHKIKGRGTMSKAELVTALEETGA